MMSAFFSFSGNKNFLFQNEIFQTEVMYLSSSMNNYCLEFIHSNNFTRYILQTFSLCLSVFSVWKISFWNYKKCLLPMRTLKELKYYRYFCFYFYFVDTLNGCISQWYIFIIGILDHF